MGLSELMRSLKNRVGTTRTKKYLEKRDIMHNQGTVYCRCNVIKTSL